MKLWFAALGNRKVFILNFLNLRRGHVSWSARYVGVSRYVSKASFQFHTLDKINTVKIFDTQCYSRSRLIVSKQKLNHSDITELAAGVPPATIEDAYKRGTILLNICANCSLFASGRLAGFH